MDIYRQYEDPWTLEEQLADAKKRFSEDPLNEDLAQEVEELRDRVNFAWQDQYQEDC